MNLNIAFNMSTVPAAWPTVSKHQPIPAHLHSRHKPAGARPSTVGLGVVDAITKVLMGLVDLQTCADGIQVKYQGSKGTRTLTAEPDPQRGGLGINTHRTWHGELDAGSSPFVLAIAEAVTTDLWPELTTRWNALVTGLCAIGRCSAPISQSNLITLSRDASCQELMLAVVDSIYYSLTERKGTQITEHTNPLPFPGLTPDNDLWFQQPVAAVKKLNASPLSDRLERLARAGGTALLAGPTGTFKTETAKRTALNLGAALHIVKGRVGLEDRDLLGAIVPSETGPVWVDGPITRAFKSATQQPTVLIVDEFTRFEAFHQALFIGALDTVSPNELHAMHITPIKDEPHRVIELPTGERIAAPVSLLTLIATCNLGDDYLQASSSIDGALLGRFNVICDVERADPAVALEIYNTVTADAVSAQAAQRLELWSLDQTFETDGNLRRALNPRVVIHLLQEFERCVVSGMPRWEAFLEAGRCTAVPFCVDRTASGRLDPVGVKLIEDQLALIGGNL